MTQHSNKSTALFRSFYDLINRIEALILVVSVLSMALNNVANVIGRVLFNHGFFFTEELNSILIILITFAGTSYAARHARHIRMTAIFDMLPPVAKKVSITIISFISAALIFLIAWFSVEYIAWIAPKGKVLPAMQIPVYMTYLWVPASLFLTALEYFLTGIRNVLNDEMYIASQIKGDGYEQLNEEI